MWGTPQIIHNPGLLQTTDSEITQGTAELHFFGNSLTVCIVHSVLQIASRQEEGGRGRRD